MFLKVFDVFWGWVLVSQRCPCEFSSCLEPFSLSSAEAPGHAYWWQNLMYTLASMAFIAAVVASARSPAKVANVALPPEKSESFAAQLQYATHAF